MPIDWKKWDKFLPVLSNVDLAKRIGCTPGAVSQRRSKLEIPSPAGNPIIDWEACDHIVRTHTIHSAAAQIGCSPSTITKRRQELGMVSEEWGASVWTEPMLRELGAISDRAFAKKYGIPRATVAYRRRTLGIPPFKGFPAAGVDAELIDFMGELVDSGEYSSNAEVIREGLALLKAKIERKRKRKPR